MDRLYYVNLDRPKLQFWTVILDRLKIRLWTVILGHPKLWLGTVIFDCQKLQKQKKIDEVICQCKCKTTLYNKALLSSSGLDSIEKTFSARRADRRRQR